MSDDEFDDSDATAEHDIRWFDLMEASGFFAPLPDGKARAIRMAKRLRIRIMEWSGNQQRPYFAQELVNGLNE